MIETCKSCTEFIKKTKNPDPSHLKKSFTKIGGCLHFAFDEKMICEKIASYVPDTIVLAGNGSVEISGGKDCWEILNEGIKKLGLVGPNGYGNGLDALTWIVAHNDMLSRTVDSSDSLDQITDYKRQIIGPLSRCETKSREVYCTCCDKKLRIPNSNKVLILTTNWDLGLFQEYKNVVQLHGRCDYSEEAILPLQNISSLMPKTPEDVTKLGSGFFPGSFLERCLKNAKAFIFWGTGLNDYDAVLWHFLRGFLKDNSLVNPHFEMGIAAKNAASFDSTRIKVSRFFPSIPINTCLCRMFSF